MLRRVLGVMTCLAVFLVLSACTQQQETQEQQSTTMDQKNTSVDQESTSVHQSDSHGKEVYLRTCASCHDSGLSGAPKLGDKPAWNSHIAKGKEHLVQSALNGIGAMPAKGGDPTLSEDDIRAAVDYLIEQVR